MVSNGDVILNISIFQQILILILGWIISEFFGYTLFECVIVTVMIHLSNE